MDRSEEIKANWVAFLGMACCSTMMYAARHPIMDTELGVYCSVIGGQVLTLGAGGLLYHALSTIKKKRESKQLSPLEKELTHVPQCSYTQQTSFSYEDEGIFSRDYSP